MAKSHKYVLWILHLCIFGTRGISAFPQMFGFRVEATEGVRYDDETGALVVYADREVTLRLYGAELVDGVEVALTSDSGNSSSVCKNHIAVSQVSGYGEVAEVEIIVPFYPPDELYKFCISDGREWQHQGSEPWKTIKSEEKPKKTTLLPMWFQIILIIVLLCCSGLFSGLNLGLMSLDKTELQILENSGSKREQAYAKVVKKVRKRGNYLLCTILLGNVLVNNTLTILMDDLTGSGSIAVVAATLGIVIFGEIIPQAICSRYGLAIGAKTIWFTWFFMFATFPLSFPISLILDCILGEEMGCVYNRDRLRELLKITYADTDLLHDEVNIIAGALELSKQTAGNIMTKLEDVFMMDMTAVLDFETMTKIIKSGFTRIPVYENSRTNVVGLLNVKDLAFVDPDDKVKLHTVCKFYDRPVNFVFEDDRLDKLLGDFKEGRCHMAMVRRIQDSGPEDPYYEVVGLVTLEDVLEEIIQAEIMDETDVHTDNRKTVKRAIVERDFSVFNVPEEKNYAHMSPQLSLAVFQFLSTTVEPFNEKHLSGNVLQKLLKQNIVVEFKPEFSPDDQSVVYQKGQPSDYFVLILEGHVQVDVGKENLVYEAGPFAFFGVSSLAEERRRAQSISSLYSESAYWRTHHFAPDFSVIANGYVMYLRISRGYYIAATRATIFERQPKDGLTQSPYTAGRLAEDAFSKEIQKAKKAEEAGETATSMSRDVDENTPLSNSENTPLSKSEVALNSTVDEADSKL